jgi:hypothetical protein
MLNLFDKAEYKIFAQFYTVGKRFTPNTIDFNKVINLENKSKIDTDLIRKQLGLNIPTLTYVEFAPDPKPENTTPTRGQEQLLSVTAPVQNFNIGLPPGTTSPKPNATIPTDTLTNESFISKYKMPLIIGAVAIGYFFLRKK